MGQIISISGREDLHAALTHATGGETLLLAAGDYGALTINGKGGVPNRFDTPLKVMSADPQNPAVFTWMDVHGAKNITLEGVKFDYRMAPDDPDHVRPFEINNSEDITIRNAQFSGDLQSDGFGYGFGLSVRDAARITLEGNEFFNWGRAAIISHSEDVTGAGERHPRHPQRWV